MSAYENTQPPYSVGPGDPPATLVAPADGTNPLGAGNFSERVAIQDVPGGFVRNVNVKFAYASAPSSVEFDIYGSLVDTNPASSPSDWFKIAASTNTAGDNQSIPRQGQGSFPFQFLCVKEVTSPGVKTTITVQQ